MARCRQATVLAACVFAKKGVGTEECGTRANTHPRTRLRTGEEDGEEVAMESGTAGEPWGLWEE